MSTDEAEIRALRDMVRHLTCENAALKLRAETAEGLLHRARIQLDRYKEVEDARKD